VQEPVELWRITGSFRHEASVFLRHVGGIRPWVRTPQRGVGDGPIDVVGADGTYVGTLPAGTDVPAAFARDGRAAYIERDEWDVPRIVVRRLPAAWR
jgi:hypothetical protein